MAIVVLSVIMSLASVAMIQQSVETIISYVKFDLQNSTLQNKSAVFCLSIYEMTELIQVGGGEGPVFELDTILICVATIGEMVITFSYCFARMRRSNGNVAVTNVVNGNKESMGNKA